MEGLHQGCLQICLPILRGRFKEGHDNSTTTTTIVLKFTVVHSSAVVATSPFEISKEISNFFSCKLTPTASSSFCHLFPSFNTHQVHFSHYPPSSIPPHPSYPPVSIFHIHWIWTPSPTHSIIQTHIQTTNCFETPLIWSPILLCVWEREREWRELRIINQRRRHLRSSSSWRRYHISVLWMFKFEAADNSYNAKWEDCSCWCSNGNLNKCPYPCKRI